MKTQTFIKFVIHCVAQAKKYKLEYVRDYLVWPAYHNGIITADQLQYVFTVLHAKGF